MNWSLTSIARDRARWDEAHPEPIEISDGLPVGMSIEEAERRGLVSAPVPAGDDGDWVLP